MYLRVRHAAPQVRDWDENAARMPGGHRRVNGSNLTVGLKFFKNSEDQKKKLVKMKFKNKFHEIIYYLISQVFWDMDFSKFIGTL